MNSPGPALERVLDALRVRERSWQPTEHGVMAQCPTHPDNRPSLAVSNGAGKVMLRCFAGCSTEQIIADLDLTWEALFDDYQAPKPKVATKPKVVAIYDYVDAGGKLLYQKLRYEPKTFRVRRPEGGGWVWNIGNATRVLYRLPHVVTAIQSNETVYIVEGEKDADRLAALGHCATCNYNGAGKWLEDYNQVLTGADIIIIADNDPPGYAHADNLATQLAQVATVQVLRVAPDHKGADLSDHLDAGHTLADLTPIDVPPAAQPPTQPEEEAPLELHRGQLRLAERFTREYGGAMLYAHGLGWHAYDGTRWSACTDGAPTRAVRRLLKLALRELATLDKKARDALYQDIRRVESSAGITGTLAIARDLAPCAIAADRLDGNPYVINTASGTVTLTEGTIRDPDPYDYISKVTQAKFHPEAQADVFDQFIGRIQPDEAMRDFLARQLGSALLGKVREQHLFIWQGTGANGKGTLRDAVAHALGDYAVEVPSAIMLQSKYGEQALAPDRMRLKGARLAFCSEIPSGARLDEAMMKRLTGGDPVNAKLLYSNPIQFEPSHTLFMLTNHLPKVHGDDPATWRRILAVPFNQVIPADERDKELPEKLAACPDALFAWVWRGWLDYLDNGLNPPQAVIDATSRYQHNSDPVARFLDEATVRDRGPTPSSALYEAYLMWCRGEGERPDLSQKAFTAAVERHGGQKGRGMRGAHWTNIGVVRDDLGLPNHEMYGE